MAVDDPSKTKRRKGLHPYVAYLKERYPDYGKWSEQQGMPVIAGHHVEDCRTLPLHDWPAMGGQGVLINLSDQVLDDAYVVEIAPGGSLNAEHHLYEELIYVVSGRGSTSVWSEEDKKVHFEWQAGSLFALPINTHHQHFNGSGSDPVRLLGVTSAPLSINLFHNLDFVFDCPYDFADRFDGRANFFGGEKVFRDEVFSGLWETNFVADVRQTELREWEERGLGSSIFLALAGGTMKVHLARFPIGTYKKAHRHGPGAHIYVLDGEGYTLMWQPGGERQRFEWHEGSLISPPNGWYHQHFNTGDRPAHYLALHRPQVIYNKGDRHQIEYEDEDPAIREEYLAEIGRRGIDLQMRAPKVKPKPPSHEVHPYVTYLKNHYYSYQSFQQDEGVPIVRGYAVEAAGVELAPWKRLGGRGSFINLSEQELDDAYVVEIAPGGALEPQRHLFEEIFYVLEGRGATKVWQPGQEAAHFEWQPGSLFTIPLNTGYQHFNGSGADRALLLSVTSAPLMINLFHSRDFIFNCPYVFQDRFGGGHDEFVREPRFVEGVPGGLIEANFIPDVRGVHLAEWGDRGVGFKHVYIALASNVMKVHLAEFEVGTYKKAHAHGPGAHILILNGTGYSLMWKPGEEPQQFDWRPGSLISPPAGWFHQHFNTGPVPIFHLAFHRPQSIYSSNERGQIEYEDEDPSIRHRFETELARHGAVSRMPRL
jgi:gentisate 1,2-dioxygenase